MSNIYLTKQGQAERLSEIAIIHKNNGDYIRETSVMEQIAKLKGFYKNTDESTDTAEIVNYEVESV